MKTLLDMFERAAREEKTNCIQFQELDGIRAKYTYQELWERSVKVSHFLKKMISQNILKLGDRVIIITITHENFLDAFFGAQLAGLVPVAFYPPVTFGALGEWIKQSADSIMHLESKLVLTQKMFLTPIYSVKSQVKEKLHVFEIDDCLKIQEKFPDISIKGSDLAFIQMSSGSTGRQKPVCITHEAALMNTQTIMEAFNMPMEEIRAVGWLPLYHDMGLVGILFGSIFAKASLTLIRPEHFILRPKIWPRTISEQRATVSVAPNFAFGLCAKRVTDDSLGDMDLSSWKVALCGAEMVHRITMQAFMDKFSKVKLNPNIITPVYGLAESTLAVSFSSIESPMKWKFFDVAAWENHEAVEVLDLSRPHIETVSVGKALKGIKLEIRWEQAKAVGEGKIGQLWISGPSLMKEYFNNPQDSQAILVDGYLNTGDLGLIYEGELYIAGRAKELIIICGKNYAPSPIEHSLYPMKELREGKVIAFGDLNTSLGTESLGIMA